MATHRRVPINWPIFTGSNAKGRILCAQSPRYDSKPTDSLIAVHQQVGKLLQGLISKNGYFITKLKHNYLLISLCRSKIHFHVFFDAKGLINRFNVTEHIVEMAVYPGNVIYVLSSKSMSLPLQSP